ncbi:hypothetical protein [Rhodanobacter sp. UC4436_H3]
MTGYASSHKYFIFFLIVVAVALSLHSPGEISIDSGRQLHEAAVGRSLSWNPPFMSAWLRFLGAGMVASSLFIAVNALVTYCGFSAILSCLTAERKLSWWRAPVSLILLANPIFFYYVGIVWKDVLIGTALVALVALMITATLRVDKWRYGLLVLAILLASVLPLMRQQGIFIAPIFATIGSYLLVREVHPKRLIRFTLFGVLMISSFGVYKAVQLWTTSTIAGSANRDVSQGLSLIMAYDVAGVIANTPDGEVQSFFMPDLVARHFKASYSAQRVDTMMADPVVSRYLNGVTKMELREVWMHALKLHPRAYLRHRVDAFSWLLGMHDIESCVPIYIGKYTLPDDAAASGGQESYDDRARLLKHGERILQDTPVFRNWFYILLLAVFSAVVIFKARGDGKLIGLGISCSAWIYLLTFVPTSIACDVRYLYPVAVLSTIGLVAVVLGYGLANNANGEGIAKDHIE